MAHLVNTVRTLREVRVTGTRALPRDSPEARATFLAHVRACAYLGFFLLLNGVEVSVDERLAVVRAKRMAVPCVTRPGPGGVPGRATAAGGSPGAAPAAAPLAPALLGSPGAGAGAGAGSDGGAGLGVLDPLATPRDLRAGRGLAARPGRVLLPGLGVPPEPGSGRGTGEGGASVANDVGEEAVQRLRLALLLESLRFRGAHDPSQLDLSGCKLEYVADLVRALQTRTFVARPPVRC
jgi:hypothetical protein